MTHHRRGLRRLLKNSETADDVCADPRRAALDERRAAIVDYAVRLTREPSSITSADVDALRTHGLGDADILAVAEVVGYYAYVNRIADGLGVALEDDLSG